jgi:hypothetical protein
VALKSAGARADVPAGTDVVPTERALDAPANLNGRSTLRARRRLFAIVTSALTGALLLAAPAVRSFAAEPAAQPSAAAPAKAEPAKAAPAKKDQSTEEVAATAGAALEETSDLFGELGGALEQTLSHGASLSTDLGRTGNALGKTGDQDKNQDQGKDQSKDQESSVANATKLSKLVGGTTDSVVGGVDNVIGSLD